MKGMTTCKICGRDFALMVEEHYVVRDPHKVGALANLVSTNPAYEYDAFDCPYCGCQNVVQDRKPICLGEDLTLNCDDEDEGISAQTEHDGCCGCKYQNRMEDEEPCVRCKHEYTDKWEAQEDE